MVRNQKPRELKVVPPTEGGRSPTEEEKAIQALHQQLQAARTELAVLKQMYAEVSVQARIALSEREQLIAEVQRAQQIIQRLTDDLQKAPAVAAPAAEEAADTKKEG